MERVVTGVEEVPPEPGVYFLVDQDRRLLLPAPDSSPDRRAPPCGRLCYGSRRGRSPLITRSNAARATGR